MDGRSGRRPTVPGSLGIVDAQHHLAPHDGPFPSLVLPCGLARSLRNLCSAGRHLAAGLLDISVPLAYSSVQDHMLAL